ncbi:MAG: glycosyltransferase, partial [Cyanobacteria bacterium J06627_15]
RKLNELGCPENCISILPAGVDLDRFQDYSRQRPYDKTTKVLSVGRLVECKGLEFGIEAVSRLKKHHPALEYWIVGDGPRYDQLKLLIDSLDAGHYVKLLGAKSQEDLKQIYRDAQIFILPSIVGSDGAEEGQGLVLLEAQSSGLPVITTKIGGIPESIVDGETGFLVPQKDSNALAEKLNFLISHPERCQQLGARGRGFVEEKFGQDRLICQLEGIYREMIEDD